MLRAGSVRMGLSAASAFALALLLVAPACARQEPAADPYAAWRSGEYDGGAIRSCVSVGDPVASMRS